MRRRLYIAVVGGLLSLPMSCGGTKNVADCPAGKNALCSPETPDEQAQDKMNSGDFNGAIVQLTTLIDADPTTYQRYTLLSAAYAARAGLDILNIAKSQGAASASLLDAFAKFIPTPKTVGAAAYVNNLHDMKTAVETLHRIPAAQIASATASAYASSAILQLTLYQTAYSVMFLNQFAISATSGALDPSQLSKISESDAEQILANLAATGQIPQVSSNAAVQAQVATTLTKINAEPGATTKDKINAYVTQNGKSTSGASNGSGT